MSTDLEKAEIRKRLRRWQGITIGSLTIGYAGYYICRSNLSVITPLLLDEYGPSLTKAHIGDISSFGVLLYAIGKTINGITSEYLGGKRSFILGMILSALLTVLFVWAGSFSDMPKIAAGAAASGSAVSYANGLPWITLLPFFVVWGMNRYVQSIGWGGLIQISSRWFEAKRMASVMGVISISYLAGDALGRLYLGALIEYAGFDWREIYYVAAATLGLIAILCVSLLKDRPSQRDLPEPLPPPGNVYGDDAGKTRIPVIQLLLPLLMSFTFWTVCLMNIGLTLIRETFNMWTPTYLKEVAELSSGEAGMTSLLFPLVGGFSSILAGSLVDRLQGRYALVVLPALLGLLGALALLAYLPMRSIEVGYRPYIALTCICLVAFFLLAPYTFCSGVLAIRLGGQRAGATSAGIIDTAGYLGATLAGSGIGRIAESYGWRTAFASLAGVTLVTFLFALVYTWKTEFQKSEPQT